MLIVNLITVNVVIGNVVIGNVVIGNVVIGNVVIVRMVIINIVVVLHGRLLRKGTEGNVRVYAERLPLAAHGSAVHVVALGLEKVGALRQANRARAMACFSSMSSCRRSCRLCRLRCKAS
jgi:hypothetical protein